MEFKEFETFVKDIPNNCVVRVRIADNVLDDEDWPVAELVINDGLVVSQRVVHPGAYRIDDMVGWSVDELSAWSSYDGTGHMPENFQEVALGPNLPDKSGIHIWNLMKDHCEHRQKGLDWCLKTFPQKKACRYNKCPIIK